MGSIDDHEFDNVDADADADAEADDSNSSLAVLRPSSTTTIHQCLTRMLMMMTILKFRTYSIDNTSTASYFILQYECCEAIHCILIVVSR